jgi:hypothetical protein
MSRIVLSPAMALLVVVGGGCSKSASPKAHPRPRKTVEDRFAELARNKDGKLSLQEFRGKATQPEHIATLDNAFRVADANHDGFLNLDEYKADLEKNRGGGRRGGGRF